MICFGGMFGIGKTTYAQALSEYLGTKLVYESVDNNPFLNLFYANPKRYRCTFLLQG